MRSPPQRGDLAELLADLIGRKPDLEDFAAEAIRHPMVRLCHAWGLVFQYGPDAGWYRCGVLARQVPPGLVDEVLEMAGRAERRFRSLPSSRVGVYGQGVGPLPGCGRYVRLMTTAHRWVLLAIAALAVAGCSTPNARNPATPTATSRPPSATTTSTPTTMAPSANLASFCGPTGL